MLTDSLGVRCKLVNVGAATSLFSQKVFIKLFYKSQFPHKSVNLSFIITDTKNKVTDLCGNRLLPNDFINTFLR